MSVNIVSQVRRLTEHTAKTVIWLVIPVLVVVSIWLPVVRHYYVPAIRISDFTIARARREPSESVLQHLQGDRLLHHGWTSKRQVVAAAKRLLDGELHIEGYPPIRLRLPFHRENLTPGLPYLQLQVAGLVAVDLLLQAYELTGEEKFFLAARRSIVEFAHYERRRWLPRGLLWNDHAVANRVFVLSDFWRVYRRHSDFQPETAETILQLVARSGELLARRQHFTFNTNHGVMQNAALLRLRLSFPTLPNTAYYPGLAMERLGEQLAFHVNEEGVVLEHSAGYQLFGIELLKLAFRYFHLLEVPVPEAWQRKCTRALRFASQLQRPDGSLPLFGDTRSGPYRPTRFDRESSQQCGGGAKVLRGTGRADPPIAWYPVAGYAVWWDGLNRWPDSRHLRQTVVAFSLFPNHAHKLADELSVLLWAGGHTWWTNLGFWPYGLPERAQAVSWNGASAPHLAGEPNESQRTSRMLFHGSSGRIAMLDVAREGPDAYSARRQVIHVKPNAWLILDSISGSPKLKSVTRWTMGPGLTLRRKTEGRYILEAKDGSAKLYASFLGSSGFAVRSLARSLGPFVEGAVPPTKDSAVPAIEVEQPADGSWVAVSWAFGDREVPAPHDNHFKIVSWRGPEHWTAILPSESGSIEVNRRRDHILVREKERALLDTILRAPAGMTPQQQDIHHAFLNAAKKYPEFRDRLGDRRRNTRWIIGVAAVQALFFFALGWRFQRASDRFQLLTSALWIIWAIWLTIVFKPTILVK
jgi:hypothetical protein